MQLLYTAMLRLDPAVSAAERCELVQQTLDLLGLTKCAHYSCDKASKQKLSGGQMRRVGIGAELVTRPSILMLDEPTSALDAVNTRLVVEALRMLANRGILVVASLHQPRFSVYQMLDALLILRSGELIYGGTRAEALPYLALYGYVPAEGENPADFYIEVAFGFIASTAEPPVAASELAGKWAATSAEQASAERAARRDGSCTRDDFDAWFAEAYGAVLSASVGQAVWAAAQSACATEQGKDAPVEWAVLWHAIDTWHVRRGERPGVVRQFAVCVQRYSLKTVRGRQERFSHLALIYLLGVLCGLLNGPDPDKDNQILFAMLFGAAFSCIVATTTLGSLGGGVIERDLFRHEASCGTSQVAECVARLLIDMVVVVIPLAPTFSLPLHGMSASHIGGAEFVGVFLATAWAFTALGYLCAIFFPAAPAVANVAISFVLSTFCSGTMGFDPSAMVTFPGLTPGFSADGLSDDGYGVFAIIPGFWTLVMQLWLTAAARPFDASRSSILYQTQSFGMLPGASYSDTASAEDAVLTYEVRDSRWYENGLLSLWLFGLVVRMLALVAFVVRNWDLKAMRRKASLHACKA